MKRMKPPVVKTDLATANTNVWGHRSLGPFLGDLEQLLMIDADAPVAFDDIPLRSSNLRSKSLVDVISKSFQSNPGLKSMLLRTGGALKADRMERSQDTGEIDIQAAVSEIRRIVEIKPTYRPRG